MRRTIAFLTGFALVAVAVVALGFVKNPADRQENSTEPRLYGTEPIGSFAANPQVSARKSPAPSFDKGSVTRPAIEEAKPALTEPADSVPPALQILHPVDGQVFSQKEVVFEGTTEVGARVFAGPYEAKVGSDGGWRIVLFLSPGQNVATFVAKDLAGNASEAKVSPVLEVAVAEHKEEAANETEHKEVVEFSAHQQYGSCGEDPPYDVFYGTGRPGSKVAVISEYGEGLAKVDDSGHWEVKVFFPKAQVGVTFVVKVKDADGHKQMFEFTRTA